MTKDRQKMLNRFEVLVGELYAHCEEMSADEDFDLKLRGKVAGIQVYLEVNFPEFFKEKK